MERKFLAIIFIPLAVVLVATGITFYIKGNDRALKGSVIDPPIIAPGITLNGPDGRDVRLSEFRGKFVLIFFGYTHCPDECPATLAILRQVRTDLGTEASSIQVLFVTTDPARDTPERLASYLSTFDNTFIGLTSSASDLANVYRDYGVTVLDNGETHSTLIFVVDRDGKLGLTFPIGMTPADMEHDLRIVMGVR